MTNTPSISACKATQYEFKQSKYDNVPILPTRCMALSPSGGGKTTLISSMILDIYKGCFQRIYVFSHSVHVDSIWEPIKKYVHNELNVDKDEQCFYEDYDAEALYNMIETQKKCIQYQKEHKVKKLFQILIVLDDMADDVAFVRKSSLLHSLYIRGRHLGISTITSTQVYKAISPIVRKNITDIFIWRLRNNADLESVIEEVSSIYDKKTVLKIYREATDVPHGFLYINLCAKDKKDVFWEGFERRISPQS